MSIVRFYWSCRCLLVFLVLGEPVCQSQTRPLLIAHRGASGYRPEHTLASYQLAMDMGADFIEPDLVVTKDGMLVARHEPNIIETTDVSKHPEFASRRTQKMIDGQWMDGFFAEDFTFDELKTLRAVQSRSYRDQSWNGHYQIPGLDEIILLVRTYERETGRKVGIYPETKHPSYFRAQGRALEEKLLDTLSAHNFLDPKRVIIQSFEVSNLKDRLKPMLKARGLQIPLVQLIEDHTHQPVDPSVPWNTLQQGDLVTEESLRNLVSTYAQGIAVGKARFRHGAGRTQPLAVQRDSQVSPFHPDNIDPLVRQAHAAGLFVHVYTMRNEQNFVETGFGSAEDEYRGLAKLGVDGFFSDFPDTALRSFP